MTYAASAPRLIGSAPFALLIVFALGALLQTLVWQPPSARVVAAHPIELGLAASLSEPPAPTRPDKPQLNLPAPSLLGRERIAFPVPDAPGDNARTTLGPAAFGPAIYPRGPTFATLPPRLFAPWGDYPQAMYPRRGSCEVLFDVAANGATTNVQAVSCTEPGFARAAEDAVGRSRYLPAEAADGAPIASAGHILTVYFRVRSRDERSWFE